MKKSNNKTLPLFEDIIVSKDVTYTKSYDRFKKLKGNRVIEKHWVAHLIREYKKKEFDVVIEVNEFMEVIDGQHRLEMCRILDVPVGYMIFPGKRIQDATSENVNQRPWSVHNYFHRFSEFKYPDYIAFENLQSEYSEFCVTVVIAVCQNIHYKYGGNIKAQIENGTFRIKDPEGAEFKLNLLRSFKDYHKKCSSYPFAMAFLHARTYKDFDVFHFSQKLQKFNGLLMNHQSKEAYMENIETLYNYNTRTDKKLKFNL